MTDQSVIRSSKTSYCDIRNSNVRVLKMFRQSVLSVELASALDWVVRKVEGLPEYWRYVESPDETNDTAALTELAAALRPIIERDEQRGMPTTGLESAAREIEWAARRDRPSAEKANDVDSADSAARVRRIRLGFTEPECTCWTPAPLSPSAHNSRCPVYIKYRSENGDGDQT